MPLHQINFRFLNLNLGGSHVGPTFIQDNSEPSSSPPVHCEEPVKPCEPDHQDEFCEPDHHDEYCEIIPENYEPATNYNTHCDPYSHYELDYQD